MTDRHPEDAASPRTGSGNDTGTTDPVRYRIVGEGVAVLELNRPAVHNAVNRDMQYRIDELLAGAVADPGVRCLVLTGAGGRALSAGWDIQEMLELGAESSAGGTGIGTESSAGGTSVGTEQNVALLREREEWLWRWYSAELPTVAALTGIAYGVGALLAGCADLRVGGPGTRFKVTGMRYGYANLSWLLPSLVGTARATEILFTGGEVSGPVAAGYGLLNRYVEDDAGIVDAAIALAEEVAALPPSGVLDAKRLMREGIGQDARTRYDAECARERDGLATRSAADIFTPFTSRTS